MAAYDNTVIDQTKFLGFADVNVGYAARQQLKSSIAPYNVLDNIISADRIQDAATKAIKIVARIYSPSTTLAASGVGIIGGGYANFAIGSQVICANGVAHKTGDVGVDTWTSSIFV